MADEDAGKVLEYLYMHQNGDITQETLFNVSDLSENTIRDALDKLEEQLLVEIGISPTDAPYENISITEQGIDTIETTGAFSDAFDFPLDLNKIARDWGS